MSTPNLGAVDEALYQALAADVNIAAVVGNAIYNGRVPKTASEVFPRITIGTGTEREANSSAAEGNTFNLPMTAVSEEIHLWSRLSRSELMAMYGAAYEVLNAKGLTLSNGGTMFLARLAWVMDMLDPDGVTLHAVLRYTATARNT